MSTEWKLVPVEPTESMISAGAENYSEGGCMGLSGDERREVVTEIWNAALSAAPDAPGEPVAPHHFAQAGKRLAAQPGLMKDLSVFVDYWGLDFYTPSAGTMDAVRDVVSALLVLALGANAAPAPEAPEAPAEAVAWIVEWEHVKTSDTKYPGGGSQIIRHNRAAVEDKLAQLRSLDFVAWAKDTPLYTHPAPQAAVRVKPLDVDALAQEIRRVDGNHSLGAGALAEALMPFLIRSLIQGEDK